MVRELKVIYEKTNKGTTLSEDKFIAILNILKNRNTALFNELKEDYEFIFQEKFKCSSESKFSKKRYG